MNRSKIVCTLNLPELCREEDRYYVVPVVDITRPYPAGVGMTELTVKLNLAYVRKEGTSRKKFAPTHAADRLPVYQDRFTQVFQTSSNPVDRQTALLNAQAYGRRLLARVSFSKHGELLVSEA